MVDLHKEETYSTNMWHVKLWLFITRKTTLGNIFGAMNKNSWRYNTALDCIPKSFCSYWWGLIAYFLIQVPLMMAITTILLIWLIVNPVFCFLLWFFGDVNLFLYGNISNDIFIVGGTVILMLYSFAACVLAVFILVGLLIKKNITTIVYDKTYDFVTNISMFQVVRKLYAAHKAKYCPMIKIENVDDTSPK